MADIKLDTSSADQANPSFDWLTDPTHKASDIFGFSAKGYADGGPVTDDPSAPVSSTDPNQYDPTNQLSLLQQVVKNVPNAIKKSVDGGDSFANPNPYASMASGALTQFSHAATIGNFDQGREKVSLERTQSPRLARPAKAEDANEVYRRWFYDMKNFANNGK